MVFNEPIEFGKTTASSDDDDDDDATAAAAELEVCSRNCFV